MEKISKIEKSSKKKHDRFYFVEAEYETGIALHEEDFVQGNVHLFTGVELNHQLFFDIYLFDIYPLEFADALQLFPFISVKNIITRAEQSQIGLRIESDGTMPIASIFSGF